MIPKQTLAEHLLKCFSMKMFVHLKVPIPVDLEDKLWVVLAIYYVFHTFEIWILNHHARLHQNYSECLETLLLYQMMDDNRNFCAFDKCLIVAARHMNHPKLNQTDTLFDVCFG